MSAIIKTLKTKTDDVEKNVYPRTVLEAVIDPETGKTLDVLLDENMPEGVVYTNDESEPETNVDDVTSASYVSYSNTDSGLEATNVQDAVDEIKDNMFRENLIPYPYYSKSYTMDGVTFTESNGTVTVNGTSTGSYSAFWCRHRKDGVMILSPGTYVLSGCPKGGSSSTYCLQVETTDDEGGYQLIGQDYGDGFTFTLNRHTAIGVVIGTTGGVTIDNLIFKPVIEAGTIIHKDTYFPYNISANSLVAKSDVVDNLLSTATDLPLSANQGQVLKNDVNFLGSRWVTKSTGEKGTVTFDVSQYGTYMLFCQWAGAGMYAIYYIDINNSVVALINTNGNAWDVTISSDYSKLNISNENGDNQWANYRLLRVD